MNADQKLSRGQAIDRALDIYDVFLTESQKARTMNGARPVETVRIFLPESTRFMINESFIVDIATGTVEREYADDRWDD